MQRVLASMQTQMELAVDFISQPVNIKSNVEGMSDVIDVGSIGQVTSTNTWDHQRSFTGVLHWR